MLLENKAHNLSSPKTQGWPPSSVNPDTKSGRRRKSILLACWRPAEARQASFMWMGRYLGLHVAGPEVSEL